MKIRSVYCSGTQRFLSTLVDKTRPVTLLHTLFIIVSTVIRHAYVAKVERSF